MSTSHRRESEMAELRTVVARLREETAAFRDRMERTKADLQPQAERARADREQAMADLRHAYDNNQLPAEERALVRRVTDGETAWRAVFTGEDDHWTAVDYRERFGQAFAAGVERLIDENEELASCLDEVQRQTRPSSRGQAL